MLLCDLNPLAMELSCQCDVQETGIWLRAAEEKPLHGHHVYLMFGVVSITLLDGHTW